MGEATGAKTITPSIKDELKQLLRTGKDAVKGKLDEVNSEQEERRKFKKELKQKEWKIIEEERSKKRIEEAIKGKPKPANPLLDAGFGEYGNKGYL